MKYFLIAGEPSGDMHAAKLMSEISLADPEACFEFFGGDLMQAQGGTLHLHYRSMAYMGVWAVISNLRTIKQNFGKCEKALLAFNPDVLILVDYPGFNLRMAKFAKLHHIKVAFYISPKIWAWKSKRVHKIKAYVDEMYCILPFETEFYKRFNYNAIYVGNPVSDIVKDEMQKPFNIEMFFREHQLKNKPIIALLAGSRLEEIRLLLPIMEQLAPIYNDYQFVVAGAPGQTEHYYRSVLKTNIPVIFNQTYPLLRASQASIVASGTATLETALLGTPQVVVYKMSMGWLLEKLKRFVLKTEFFSLVNLIAGKEVVKELFQSQVTVESIKTELDKILYNQSYRSNIINEYRLMGEKLKTEGAAHKAASSIVKSIKMGQ
jgi:lipid-A-disaccharide synthase